MQDGRPCRRRIRVNSLAGELLKAVDSQKLFSPVEQAPAETKELQASQSIMPAFGHEAQAPAPQGLGAPEGAALFERGAKVESNCSNCRP
jgi:hypothetical protein